jgi:PIF1-like helicase
LRNEWLSLLLYRYVQVQATAGEGISDVLCQHFDGGWLQVSVGECMLVDVVCLCWGWTYISSTQGTYWFLQLQEWVAPTGSAAVLLGGSTYHSAFAIDTNGSQTSNIQLTQVKLRLQGVKYVFLDEVSMLSCREMYLISTRLAQVLNNTEMLFGGMNMIFARDFTQLPPVIGHQHMSLYSRSAGITATSLQNLELAMGKALWHQVTTVIILHTNMRQHTETAEDLQFHQVLANMRYKACTPADITFLKTHVSSDLPGHPNASEKGFRNVSIITSLNTLKDEINQLGSLRFALETGQTLVDFISIISVPSEESTDLKLRKPGTRRGRRNKLGKIPEKIEEILWCRNASNGTQQCSHRDVYY